MADYRRLVHSDGRPSFPEKNVQDTQFYPAPKGHMETAEGMRDTQQDDSPPPNPAPVSDIDARTRGR